MLAARLLTTVMHFLALEDEDVDDVDTFALLTGIPWGLLESITTMSSVPECGVWDCTTAQMDPKLPLGSGLDRRFGVYVQGVTCCTGHSPAIKKLLMESVLVGWVGTGDCSRGRAGDGVALQANPKDNIDLGPEVTVSVATIGRGVKDRAAMGGANFKGITLGEAGVALSRGQEMSLVGVDLAKMGSSATGGGHMRAGI